MSSRDSEVPIARPGETILVVEDNASVRQTVVRQLKGLGYSVVEAGDGPAALKILEQSQQSHQIQLLFTDIVMPGGMTGADLARQAHKLRPDLKIVLTSGFPEVAASERFDYAKERLLSKPYRRQELAFTIRDALDAKA